MALYLVNPGVDLTLELYIDHGLEEAMSIQWERIQDKSIRQIFTRKLEKQLERLLAECMDWDLKEPTPAQISYATIIAQRLGVSIPSEASQYRFHMALFIEAHNEQYQASFANRNAQKAGEMLAAHTLVADRLKQSEQNP